ncbi:HAMP domain-containing histidine kinase [Paenibacillus sp. SYP-B3998]|uniref:Signal transduction histidine-protein kinase ArlS n=1 Tax=Paenibacillus sp. SYP-B3998 TaxID=2678564 RepID=A0A6G3ZZ37_9BACL|nr:HAMP domain-containing histidine kinase [Paenibacillus sp. SYP-B3998]NEW06667.1 HAMP domain-containing histidine kinase [Paenibacillus sp. SYP-B3998]
MLRRLPIKWKLMLGATMLIFLLFTSYNFAQYMVLKFWMLNQEKDAIQVTMGQMQDYLQIKTNTTESLNAAETQVFIDKIIGKNQMIRMIDQRGETILTATNHFETDWIVSQPVNQPQLFDTVHGEDHLLIYRSPISTQIWSGTIEIASNLETFDHFNQTLFWVMVIGGLFAIFISGLSGLAIAKQLMRPIRALDTAIRSVKQKGLKERVTTIENGDELSSLTQLFNDLMDQLESSFRQQKQFVEDASHELRTPITILEGHLSLLNRWGKTEPTVLEESLDASLQEVRRLKGIVQQLLTLTKIESQSSFARSELIPIEPLLVQTVKRVGVLHPEFDFEVEASQIDGQRLNINALHMEQILLIVLDNAIKFSIDHKKIVVQAHCSKNEIQITVQDHGIGIPLEDLPNVFDRFYRVDKARNREIGGTGLGLSIAKQLVQNYQGEIFITSIENEGTVVTLKFPISQVI